MVLSQQRKRVVFGLLAAFFAGSCFAAEPPDPIVAEVMKRDAELSAAHGRGDMTTYLQGLSSRYVYIDVGGRRVTAGTLATRRANDQLRLVSSESSEDEALRLADTVVLLRGLEKSKFTYFGGLPRQGSSRWTALWVREEDNQWRLLAETATPVVDDGGLPFIHVPQSAATLRVLQGRWKLDLPTPMEMVLKAEDGALVATLTGQTVSFAFKPASATRYYASDRPFELRFDRGRNKLELITWGQSTMAVRVKEVR